jgi:hypothetical protein
VRAAWQRGIQGGAQASARGAGKGGKNPVRDKKKLVDELRAAVKAATDFCAGHGARLCLDSGTFCLDV